MKVSEDNINVINKFYIKDTSNFTTSTYFYINFEHEIYT